MTTNTTRLNADITRTKREELRIRILNFLAIDKTMRAGDNLSPLEAANRREEALLLIDAAIRAQGMSHPRHFIH